MTDTTQASATRRGALYLSLLGVVGLLIAGCSAVWGLSEIWTGRFLGGFGSLVF